jgi:hypothetical protein
VSIAGSILSLTSGTGSTSDSRGAEPRSSRSAFGPDDVLVDSDIAVPGSSLDYCCVALAAAPTL